jgi:hypothetical protein
MSMSSIRNVLVRDLEAVREEVLAYPDEESLWQRVPGIGNSGGNLALHLAGNLQHFVGSVLGETGYLRDRDSEFDPAKRPRSFLLEELSAARLAVATTLDRLPETRCSEAFSIEFAGRRLSVDQFLVHLATHLAFHLGQIDYHRRILVGAKGDVKPVSIALIRT